MWVIKDNHIWKNYENPVPLERRDLTVGNNLGI